LRVQLQRLSYEVCIKKSPAGGWGFFALKAGFFAGGFGKAGANGAVVVVNIVVLCVVLWSFGTAFSSSKKYATFSEDF
jgi:hypothetical protein